MTRQEVYELLKKAGHTPEKALKIAIEYECGEDLAMWVYIQSEPKLWTVGFYDPNGKWHSDKDFVDPEAAAERVRWLNGGN